MHLYYLASLPYILLNFTKVQNLYYLQMPYTLFNKKIYYIGSFYYRNAKINNTITYILE